MEGETKENYYWSKQKSRSHQWGMKAVLNVLDE